MGFCLLFRVPSQRTHVLSIPRLGLSILDAARACLDVVKKVSLEENGGFLLKLAVSTGFLPTFQGFEAENGYFIEFPT